MTDHALAAVPCLPHDDALRDTGSRRTRAVTAAKAVARVTVGIKSRSLSGAFHDIGDGPFREAR